MTEVRFYHLTRSTLEQALPPLLEKSLERGWRAVVLAGSSDRAEQLDMHLWTYRENTFLPHGTTAGGHAARQPVLIAAEDIRPNDAHVLFATEGTESGLMDEYGLSAICSTATIPTRCPPPANAGSGSRRPGTS